MIILQKNAKYHKNIERIFLKKNTFKKKTLEKTHNKIMKKKQRQNLAPKKKNIMKS